MNIPYHLFEMITNNFSVDLIIGSGGFGNVYKGILYNEEWIAVKLLHPVQALDAKPFNNEVGNLFRVDHPNIVGLLGYCDEVHSKFVEHNGEKVPCKHIYRILCFEYFPDGSLDKKLQEQSFAPCWSTRYNIIKGICEGLNYLHGCEPQIFHLDLKPANILLDRSMLPKLADFGLSRLFSESHTRVTQQRIGTDKYMPPEYITRGAISDKNDVFSFGVVMIEIMEGYSLFQEIDDVTQIKRELLAKWSSMIEPTMKYRPQLLLQVKTCIDIAMCCMDPERKKRPTIENILTTLDKTETQIPNKQLAVVTLSPTVVLKNSLAEMLNMKMAEQNCTKISTTNLDMVPGIREASSNVQEPSIIKNTEDRETTSNVEEGLIIGRSEEKKEILSILSESGMNELVILPIYGIGGIGKTTLAQLVYSDTQFSGYYRVWVYVSEHLNLYNIGNTIISQLSKKFSNIANMHIMHDLLGKLFADKRILIVLDDLWEDKPRELDKLKAMLKLGKGSKVIIVTTRDEAIAKIVCTTVKNVPYKLEILTDDRCWDIIKEKSDFENQVDKNFLDQIGRDIAIKCGGVALAAQSLGYMLRYMTSDQWESVRDSDIWNLSTSEDPSVTTHEVLASLKLSYYHMNEVLKLCFSYCAVFPKGHRIPKYDLIHQWIALEFMPYGIFDSMQLCKQYVRQLLGLSFLQYATSPLNERREEFTTFFTMHDLVHDLATATLADKGNKNGNGVGSSCPYALVRDPSKPLHSFVSSPENLKALHFRNCGVIKLSDGAISPAKCLHILDLGGRNGIQELPDYIAQLKQLRYLHAPDITYPMIPNCITELSKLNYLSLRYSDINALPDSIGDMKGLMHLNLSHCQQLSKLPLSFGDLKQLVYLDLSSCRVHILEYLGGFTKLQYLNLSRSGVDLFPFKVLAEVTGKLTKLQYLNLSFFNMSYQDFQPLPDLEVFGKLTRLRYLDLAGCMDMMSEADIYSLQLSISSLDNLEHLDLSYTEKLNSIPERIGNLTKLHTLDLSRCNIQKLPAWIDKMASLKFVNMTIIECSSNLILFAAANPRKMKISKLEDVKSLEEAQSTKLIEKRDMFALELEWTVGCHKRSVDDNDLLEKLVPPNSIKSLDIIGYRSRSFPTNWLMGIGQYLPIVNEITLKDISNCNSLPPLGQLPFLTILRLYRLGSLEELNTADSCGELMFPELEELDIISCPKLRMKPFLPRALRILSINTSDIMLTSCERCVAQTSASSSSSLLIKLKLVVTGSRMPLHKWRLLQHVPAIRELIISDCSDLTCSSAEIIQHISSLKLLDLKDDILTELPTWLLELNSLEQLTIRVSKLDKLNDSRRQLTTGLKSLILSGCGSMVSLPQWLGELTSLQKLEITECKGIRYLPRGIRQLKTLSHIRIESYDMYFDNNFSIKMHLPIPADTDEVDIQEFVEEYKKEPKAMATLEEATRALRIQEFKSMFSSEGSDSD